MWSSTPHPAGQASPTRVRHGAGYTVYERQCHGLTQEMTVFVPRGASLKVVRLRVTNTLARHRRLTATYFAEWVLGSRRDTQRSFVVSEFDRDQACLMATCHWNDEFGGRVAFLASKSPAHGYTADRGEFLGRRGDEGPVMKRPRPFGRPAPVQERRRSEDIVMLFPGPAALLGGMQGATSGPGCFMTGPRVAQKRWSDGVSATGSTLETIRSPRSRCTWSSRRARR